MTVITLYHISLFNSDFLEGSFLRAGTVLPLHYYALCAATGRVLQGIGTQ